MRKFSIILLLLCLMTACGQRGPLFLPNDAAQNQSENSIPPIAVTETEGAEPEQPKE